MKHRYIESLSENHTSPLWNMDESSIGAVYNFLYDKKKYVKDFIFYKYICKICILADI